MPRLIYRDFATDQHECDSPRSLLQEMLEECVPPTETKSWRPWLAIFSDGHPIFSARHGLRPRGFSIQLDTAPEDPSFFDFFHRVFDESGMVDGPIEHLVIRFTPSEETLPRVREAMRNFVTEN